MALGNRQRVRDLMDAALSALDETSVAFDEEFPVGPTPPTPTPGPIIKVAVGENVQAAFDQARLDGATLQLAVGTHRTNLVVPPGEALPVVITSDTTALPPPRTRITRDAASGLATLVSANGQDPVVRFQCGSSDVHVVGVAFGPQQYDKTQVMLGTDAMTTVDEQPSRVSFDRVLWLGDPVRGQHRGVMLHARGVTIRDSAFYDFHEEGRDSQCVAAWNGGQYLVLKNTLFEGAGENILFGGAAARTEEMAPKHVVIEDCLFSKNPAWQSGMEHQPNVKCLFEIKQLRHAVIRRNRFEHCWKANWDGLAIAIKCTDQSGKEPWTLTEDIDFVDNTICQVGQVFSIVGANDDGKPTQLLRDLRIRRVTITELDVAPWSGRGSLFVISNVPDRMTVDHVTCVGNNYAVAELAFNIPARGQAFTFTNSVFWQGAYGIKGPAGMDAWDWAADLGYAPLVTGNAIRNHPDRTPDFGPGNERFAEADFDASLTAEGDVIAGSPVDSVTTTDGEAIGSGL